ncbi:MAG TPA: NUDIX domain-containing protein [Allosphingosinicella sp.]
MQPGRFLLRAVLTGLNQIRRAFWSLTGRRGRGVLAVPLTPERRVVLVRLTYARGWHLPGGGVGRGEAAQEAALRELAEEIGMTAYGEVARLDDAGASPVFLVRDVVYAPRRTYEIEEVGEFAPKALPPDAIRSARRGVAAAMAAIRRA